MKFTTIALLVIPLLVFYHPTNAQFVDVTNQLGINHTYGESDIKKVGGLSFYDWDRDGWDDLLFTTKNFPMKFYHNNNGEFELIAPLVLIAGQIKQALWVDFDNDGDSDLFVVRFLQPYVLFRNDGDNVFTDITSSVGLPTTYHETETSSWGDYNNDGWLDVYICNYNDDGITNYLFRNNAGETFTDVTAEQGVSNDSHYSQQAIFVDFDRDGWQDLFVANDRVSCTNYLYRNMGGTGFEDISESANVDYAIYAMCAASADYDNDRDMDIYVTNNWTGNLFHEQLDSLEFEMVAMETGTLLNQFSWAANFFDYDNNGNLDLAVAVSPALFDDGQQPFFVNNGDGTFTNDYANVGWEGYLGNVESSAIGDYNNDGYLDLVNCHFEYESSKVWENMNISGNYLKATLEGVISNRDGIGSYIEAYRGGTVLTRYTMCGEGFMNQNSQHTHFGVGNAFMLDSLKVIWPSGHVDTWYGLGVNQSIDLLEGSTLTNTITYDEDLILCPGESVTLDAGLYNSYLWSNGHDGQYLEVSEGGSYSVEVMNEMGFHIFSPTLVVYSNPEPSVLATIDEISCVDYSNGNILLQLEQGAIDEIMWNTGADGAAIFDLSPGTYSYQLSDNFGCTTQGSFELNNPEPFEFTATVNDLMCSNDNSGSINLESENYIVNEIWWSNNATDLSMTLLPAGTYVFDLIYASVCEYTDSIEVTEPLPVSTTVYVTDASCFGAQDATAIAEASGGNGDQYFYDWGGFNPQTLASGEYTVVASDLSGCTGIQSFVIGQPEELSVQVATESQMENGENGSASITISGGTQPYEILWSTNDFGVTSITDLSAGSYWVSATDNNLCAQTVPFNIEFVEYIAALSENELLVYPNPTERYVHVLFNNTSQALTIRVMDALGRICVLPTEVTGDVVTVDLENLSSGVYYLKMMNTMTSAEMRILKK